VSQLAFISDQHWLKQSQAGLRNRKVNLYVRRCIRAENVTKA
jgi:hypothetical protein